jgi:hypothetical protein
MARRFTHYDIVISCPSDMTEERATVQRAVDDVNERNANYRGLHFDVKYWDKDVLFCSGDPQIIINNTLIQNADLIVALFGKKLGTPTERAKSGTIEEIEMMIKEGKQVFVCFDERDVVINGTTSDAEIEDLIKVRDFKKNYKGLYIEFKSREDLIERLKNQLRLYIESLGTYDDPCICNLPVTFQELKGNRKGIERAKKIICVIRTGKIFLGKYYNHIEKMLDNGGEFHYISSKDYNVGGDTAEFSSNQTYVIERLKSLQKRYGKAVKIYYVQHPVNCSMIYIENGEHEKCINVKFNFQTRMKGNHPMFDIYINNPLFPIFRQEINGILNAAELVEFDN